MEIRSSSYSNLQKLGVGNWASDASHSHIQQLKSPSTV